MRERIRGAALAATIAIAAALVAGPLAAQQGRSPAYQQDPRLNPEDQLAPSQLAQPMPAPVAEPTAAPPRRRTAPARHAENSTHPLPGPTRPRAPRSAVHTTVACSGPFAKDSGMLALAVAYDARNMIFKEETVQGSEVGATVLFPKDPRRRLEVWWSNPNRTGTFLIDIAGRSIWTAPKGLRLGLSLEQLQRLNHRPFKLNGFDRNAVATVADWNGGELAALPGGCKAGVNLKAGAKTSAAADLPATRQYSSDDPALRRVRPTVSEILIGY